MKAWLIRIDDAAAHLEDWFLIAAHALIAGLVVLSVVLRYVFHDPLTWGQEFIVGLFTWLVFIGAAAALRHRMHIRIDAIGSLFLRPRLRFMNAITVTAGVIVVAALLWAGIVNWSDISGVRTPMLDIQQAWFDSALPVGLALLLLHVARILAERGPAGVFAGQLEKID